MAYNNNKQDDIGDEVTASTIIVRRLHLPGGPN